MTPEVRNLTVILADKIDIARREAAEDPAAITGAIALIKPKG